MVECGGVGYLVAAPERTLLSLPALGEEATLHTRLVVREDAWTLYGFLQTDERRLFDLLTGVSGVGPKAALALLSSLEPEDLALAIASGDARLLTKAPGIGLRTAERIVVDLKEKMAAEALEQRAKGPKTPARPAAPADELLDALLALGYRRSEAESAADDARASAEGVPAQLRHALRMLRKG